MKPSLALSRWTRFPAASFFVLAAALITRPAPAATEATPVLTQEQRVDQACNQIFKQCDLNGDGFISKSEAEKVNQVLNKPAHKGKAARKQEVSPVVLDFDKTDRNKDGKLSRDEVKRQLSQEKEPTWFVSDYEMGHDQGRMSHDVRETPTFVGIRFEF